MEFVFLAIFVLLYGACCSFGYSLLESEFYPNDIPVKYRWLVMISPIVILLGLIVLGPIIIIFVFVKFFLWTIGQEHRIEHLLDWIESWRK